MQCEERVYSIRRATSAVGRQGVQFVEKVCSIRNVTCAIRGEKVCSTKRVASTVWISGNSPTVQNPGFSEHAKCKQEYPSE